MTPAFMHGFESFVKEAGLGEWWGRLSPEEKSMIIGTVGGPEKRLMGAGLGASVGAGAGLAGGYGFGKLNDYLVRQKKLKAFYPEAAGKYTPEQLANVNKMMDLPNSMKSWFWNESIAGAGEGAPSKPGKSTTATVPIPKEDKSKKKDKE
jgi:hypothetical protein